MENKGHEVFPAKALRGKLTVPGDKSLSHRSVMLASLANHPVMLTNFLHAEDCLSTIRCMRSLGVKIDESSDGSVTVHGVGLYGLSEPDNVLDAGNSGTTMRLLCGILAGQSFFSVLTGDDSLRRRPMARIVTPLTKMGSRISGREQSRYAPLAIHPGESLHGIDYVMPVASAQVKSALMFAALYASSATTIEEPYPSRNHTERMMEMFGVDVEQHGMVIRVKPVTELKGPDNINIPGDFSSAAYLLVAATIIPGSDLTLLNVGVNQTRTGLLDVLISMGAKIEVFNRRLSGQEPVADIRVESAQLKGTIIGADIIPRLIDEIPILSVAALFASGQTVIRGAEELRVKETDRLRAMACELSRVGATVIEKPDGMIIEGEAKLHFAKCETYADHRVAMSMSVVGLAAGGVHIDDPACIDISFPGFYEIVKSCSVESSK